MLVIMAGLPASGKSTLAQKLATELSGVILNKDRIRAALFSPELIEYSRQQDDFCMEIVYQTAGYLLQRNQQRCVIIDGRPFSKREQLERVFQVGHELGTPIRLIECVVDDDTARQRLEQDQLSGAHPAANRNFEHYLASKRQADPIQHPRIVLKTDATLFDDLIQQALAYIRSGQV